MSCSISIVYLILYLVESKVSIPRYNMNIRPPLIVIYYLLDMLFFQQKCYLVNLRNPTCVDTKQHLPAVGLFGFNTRDLHLDQKLDLMQIALAQKQVGISSNLTPILVFTVK